MAADIKFSVAKLSTKEENFPNGQYGADCIWIENLEMTPVWKLSLNTSIGTTWKQNVAFLCI